MEIGLESRIPTYAGGLGVLAGDMLRAAADSGSAAIGITLLYRHGYFRQVLDADGRQTEADQPWSPEDVLEPTGVTAEIELRGRVIQITAWRYTVRGQDGEVPVYLLDTDLPANDPRDRDIADRLYGGDEERRLTQEAVLGFGGIAVLRALGYSSINVYHMNEGHSALLGLALLRESAEANGGDAATFTAADIESVRRRCVFTTHTPVPAGHDKFPRKLVASVLGERWMEALEKLECCQDGNLNMTFLGLFFSRYINGVSMRHEQVSASMFPNYPINSITNGVHALTWTSGAFKALYDRYLPQWRGDSGYLRYAITVPLEDIRAAHLASKRELLSHVERETGVKMDASALTIGFGRRSTGYKRADLLFYDIERLRSVVERAGPLQLVFGGKAHPKDAGGKEIIRRLHEMGRQLEDGIRFVYLPDYDMDTARLMCAGSDLWLNTPHKPFEASGTSGMKAAINGVPSLSVLDGWWVEGCIEGVTGWAIGKEWSPAEVSDTAEESGYLYEKLELIIAPMFYSRPDQYAAVMRAAIALNGSFYTAQRMFDQYERDAYRVTAGGTVRSRSGSLPGRE
jgi:starch phosphorylase